MSRRRRGAEDDDDVSFDEESEEDEDDDGDDDDDDDDDDEISGRRGRRSAPQQAATASSAQQARRIAELEKKLARMTLQASKHKDPERDDSDSSVSEDSDVSDMNFIDFDDEEQPPAAAAAEGVMARMRPPVPSGEQTRLPAATARIDIQRSVKSYLRQLGHLQVELNKLQAYVAKEGLRVVVVFEGRDTAGKGGCIRVLAETLNPRICRVVALPAPSKKESTQWYFQRYVANLPSAGEIVLYDRSWYNRAGVERVMNFCTRQEYSDFLRDCPIFEKMLTDSGIILRKYWLDIKQEVQDARLAARMRVPTKRWKLSKMDLASREKWAEYTKARDAMFEATHRKPDAVWQVVDANSKMLARLNLIRHFLGSIPYKVVPIDIPQELEVMRHCREPNICKARNPKSFSIVPPVFHNQGSQEGEHSVEEGM